MTAGVGDRSPLDGGRQRSRELTQPLPAEMHSDKRQADGDDTLGLTEHCAQSHWNHRRSRAGGMLAGPCVS